MDELRKVGAPIKTITPKEGVPVTGNAGYIALFNKAPHPNAARIFINWLLTKEGQARFSEVTGWKSARLDVPTDHLDPVYIMKEGVKYFSAIDEEFLKSTPKYAPIAQEIFGPLLR